MSPPRVTHNHVTRDIKPEGKCPACDLYHQVQRRGTRGERWVGRQPRQCGEHRCVGLRARCFDCEEWCSEASPCRGCLTEVERADEYSTEVLITVLKSRGYNVLRVQGYTMTEHEPDSQGDVDG